MPVAGLPAGTVVRGRLIDLLDEAVTCSRLTLVCAPAGSGKSVLVSSWAVLRAPGPLVWVGTESPEITTTEFWHRLERELQTALTDGPSAHTAGVIDPGRLGAVVRRMTGAAPVVVVVDEGARPPDPTLHRELHKFVERAGGSVRLVFVTRADPVLPLHRYRLAHALSEIRADDLRFTATEAREFFAESNADVTEEQVATLVEKTGGWPAGLSFASSFLMTHRDTDKAVRTFTGSSRAVSDFLIREVLAAQPANVRKVLLRSSVADELPVGLFEALTGAPDGHAVLGFLTRANTFMSPVPGKPHSFQYPPLLREFLRTRLAYEHPELVPELHQVAARWWFDNGFVPEAVGHAVAAGDWSAAAGFVVDGLVLGQILDDRLDSLARLAEMPTDTAGAPAAIVLAALLVRDGSLAEAADALAVARTRLASARPAKAARGEPNDFALFSVELIEGALASLTLDVAGGLDLVRIAERHLSNLVGSGEVHPELRALLTTYRARLQLWSGDILGARRSMDEAAESARAARWTAGEASSLAGSALLAAISGDLGDALLVADRAREEMETSTGVDVRALAVTAVACAWVMTEQSLTGPARGQVAKADELGATLGPVSGPLLEVVRARLLHAKGDYTGARDTLAAVGGTQDEAVPAWLTSWVALTERVHAASEAGTEQAADGTGADQMTLVDWQGQAPVELQVARGIVEADAHLRADREGAAVAALLRALRIAARQRLRRPFTQVPPRVRDLLRRRDELHQAHPWLVTTESAGRPSRPAIVQPFPHQRSVRSGHAGEARRPAGSARPLVVEELTTKELEVLGHLAELHTTDEIAAGMFISVNTVRTHVRNILRKLGVDRRNEAVRRAWELQLLPMPERNAEDGS